HMAVESSRFTTMGGPGRAVGIDELTHEGSRTDTRIMGSMPRRIFDGFRVVRGIPQRRVGLLQRTQLHGNITITVVLSLKCQALFGQTGNKDRHYFIEHRPSTRRIDPEVAE